MASDHVRGVPGHFVVQLGQNPAHDLQGNVIVQLGLVRIKCLLKTRLTFFVTNHNHLDLLKALQSDPVEDWDVPRGEADDAALDKEVRISRIQLPEDVRRKIQDDVQVVLDKEDFVVDGLAEFEVIAKGLVFVDLKRQQQ